MTINLATNRLKEPESFIQLAVVQMEPLIGEKSKNIAKTTRLINKAADKGAQLIIFPELCNSGYIFNTRNEAFELAESITNGPTVTQWTKLTRERNIYLVAGIAEKDGEKLYNSAVLIGPKGVIGTYRKLHLWFEEQLFFHPGNLGLPVFHLPFGCLGMHICYDLWFPETSRILALQGADIICSPTNWVPSSKPFYDEANRCIANYLAIATAQSNAVFIACADRIGVERGQPFEGRSIIIEPSGRTIAGPASANREEVLITDINLMKSRKIKTTSSMNHRFGDRRTDVYDRMLGYC
jgi:predicted amidohydrolase